MHYSVCLDVMMGRRDSLSTLMQCIKWGCFIGSFMESEWGKKHSFHRKSQKGCNCQLVSMYKNIVIAWDFSWLLWTTSLQKIMKSWGPHSGTHTLRLKSKFSLLSNNHIYVCKTHLEEYYNKLESSRTLVKVEKIMSRKLRVKKKK